MHEVPNLAHDVPNAVLRHFIDCLFCSSYGIRSVQCLLSPRGFSANTFMLAVIRHVPEELVGHLVVADEREKEWLEYLLVYCSRDDVLNVTGSKP